MFKKIIIIYLFAYIFVDNVSYTQTLFFCFNDATSINYPLADIKKIDFSSSQISIVKFNGDSFTKSLDSWLGANFIECSESSSYLQDLKENDLYNTVTLYPNPVENNLTIEYSLNSADDIQIDFINVEGLLLKSLVQKYLEGGNYFTHINADQMDEIGFVRGMYLCKISSSKSVVIKKLIIQ